MTRLTLPKNHGSHRPEKTPDLPPLPVDPDRGPTPDLLPDDPDRDGVSQPVASGTVST